MSTGKILKFSDVLLIYSDQANIGDLYFMRDIKEYWNIAKELEKIAQIDSVDDMIDSI